MNTFVVLFVPYGLPSCDAEPYYTPFATEEKQKIYSIASFISSLSESDSRSDSSNKEEMNEAIKLRQGLTAG